MGANHSHGTTALPVSRRTVLATLAVVVPVALVTVAALIWLWPGDGRPSGPSSSSLRQVSGTIVDIVPEPCPAAPDERAAGPAAAPGSDACGDARVTITGGPEEGRTVTTDLPTGPGAQRFAVGEDVVLVHMPDGALDAPEYLLSDHDRSAPLWLFVAAFALAVVAFGRWRGLTALIGLAVTFVLLLTFVVPAILAGEPPALVAIVGSAAIMLAVLYLTHGFTIATSMAVLGTLVSLTLTGLLSAFAIDVAHLAGVTDDSSFLLDSNYRINGQGLLLAGIIIGALGVLDDVTVTQAATVGELAVANPGYTFGRLYRAAARVGRAHIASVINTIVLAYAGAALPLLLLFSVGDQPLGDVLRNPVLAQEIIRSIVGTLGLIAAVPVTTALAALAAPRRRSGEEPEGHRPAGPAAEKGWPAERRVR
ncbi:YibE/F family protein [Microbispora catharanthi]|uniref:YibE/F family protein n=1 Tax=Microbispora catharanthi TaxID=1712871 RepID=A0A5N6BTC2_9ACTN|nr:YibE/F family protein [Microbispora catharanthi]KAB8183724.1 YibE/F family protein [Microbispora catharanthi]